MRGPRTALERSCCSLQLERARVQQRRPSAPHARKVSTVRISLKSVCVTEDLKDHGGSQIEETGSGFASRALIAPALQARDAAQRPRPNGEFGRHGGHRAPRLGFAARPGSARWRAPAHPAPRQGARLLGLPEWRRLGVGSGWDLGVAACPGKFRPVLRHQQFH
ncbi:unnamed protein product [Rangifer tarandus platyrhynchus]|uniref:Uncharacterized protein n=2 Tax=Rangifer tarandus platyrhynchus TaxID=3082113 RepID=A0ABN8ZMT5_RANTA|nr:unnamed protein product [Rangifer tarandus platyrhynchus]CAI9710058.1 unnamed protein product [Rangifer tarandus platyrhynchus]